MQPVSIKIQKRKNESKTAQTKMFIFHVRQEVRSYF